MNLAALLFLKESILITCLSPAEVDPCHDRFMTVAPSFVTLALYTVAFAFPAAREMRCPVASQSISLPTTVLASGTDQLIVPNGTVHYYERVSKRDHAIGILTSDYYRFFQAPGVEHCGRGPGPFPSTILGSLVQWVDEGKAPESQPAESLPDLMGLTWKRPLCLYPKKQVWTGQGDPRQSAGWTCQ